MNGIVSLAEYVDKSSLGVRDRRVLIWHNAFVCCGCPHRTGNRITGHWLIHTEACNAWTAALIVDRWSQYHARQESNSLPASIIHPRPI